MEQAIWAAVLLSMAEEAIARVTGESGTQEEKKCRGCQGLEWYATTKPHLSCNCPHQADPEVRARLRRK